MVLNVTHPANHTTWISRKDVLLAKSETRSLSRSSALRCALDFASRSAIFCTFRKTGDGVGALTTFYRVGDFARARRGDDGLTACPSISEYT